MTIIEQLEQSVSLPILGEEQSIAHISLLEQFYALIIARLAIPKVYTQLLQASHQSINPQSETSTSEPLAAVESLTTKTTDSQLFSQLWQDPNQRELIIDELVATHHVDKSTTVQLITSASTLAYHELKGLANGQFLPAFLQQQQSEIRHYLPVWAESVLTEDSANAVDSTSAIEEAGFAKTTTNRALPTTAVDTEDSKDADISKNTNENHSIKATTKTVATEPLPMRDASDKSHSAPHIAIDDSDHSISTFRNTRQRNKRDDSLLRLLLLGAAIAALVLLWLFVIQPNYLSTAEPVVVESATIVAEPELVAPVLTPVDLLVAVDNSGSLYTCNATVGDATLQEGLRQALVMSFGEQASICELKLELGVADSFATINVGLLPSFFTLLQSVPFARLQLQNDIITIESPDDSLSQRLLTDMRTLAPTATITTKAPLASTSIDNKVMNDSTTEGPSFNNDFDDQPAVNGSFDSNDNSDNSSTNNINNGNFNNGNFNSENSNSANNSAYNGTKLNNNAIANTRPADGMSTAEVDDLANSVIVAEQLSNEARVETNIAAEE